MAAKARLKVLPEVTVSKLETAIDRGMENLRHRSLDRCLTGLDDMSWKTALATHAAQLCNLEPLLRELLKVCQNGLLPNSNLLKALQACHGRKNFEAVRTKPCLRGPVVAEHPELLHAQIADDDRQAARPYRQQAPQEELLQESEQAAAAVGLGSASDH